MTNVLIFMSKAVMTIQSLMMSETILKRTDIITIARKGIEKKKLSDIKKFTSLTDRELASVLPISERQLVRYEPTHILNKTITAHLIQIIELFHKGIKLFGNDKFQMWLRTPNKVLGKNKPLELLDTSLGIEMVEDIIGRIEHGVYS